MKLRTIWKLFLCIVINDMKNNMLTRDRWILKILGKFWKNLEKIFDFGRFSKINLDMNNSSPGHIKVSPRRLKHKFQVFRKKLIITQFLNIFYIYSIYIVKMHEKSLSGSEVFSENFVKNYFDPISLKNS